MKNHILTLFTFITFSIGANALGFDQARQEALFLTDKMAYELNLSMEQMEAVYEINLDYLLCVNRSQDILGVYWDRRNADMRFVLSRNQYARYINTNYFYRPLNWVRNSWSLALYGIYVDRHAFYYARPNAWFSFRGGRNTGRRSLYSGRNFYPPQGNGRPATGHTPPPSGNNGHSHRPGYGGNGQYGNHPGNNPQNGGYRPDDGNPQNRGHRPSGNNPQNGGNHLGGNNPQNGGYNPGGNPGNNPQNGGYRPGGNNSNNPQNGSNRPNGNNPSNRPSRTR